MIWLPRTTDNSTYFAQSLEIEVSRVDCLYLPRLARIFVAQSMLSNIVEFQKVCHMTLYHATYIWKIDLIM